VISCLGMETEVMYKYRVTVEALEGNTLQPQMQFEVENHDDITAVAARLSGKIGLSPDATEAFAVGLKLFGETIVRNRESPHLQ
jgi:hypothetical protein